jgi:hypothetical protein
MLRPPIRGGSPNALQIRRFLAVKSSAAIHSGLQCGRGGTVDATDLSKLSALRETEDAELPKLGETSHVAIPNQARRREGVETRRAAPKANARVKG